MTIKKTLKAMLYLIISIVVIFIITYILFVNFSSGFGGDINDHREKKYTTSTQYKNHKFHNTKDVPKELTLKDNLRLAYTFFTTKVPNGKPQKDIIPKKINSDSLKAYNGTGRLFWFGHSSFLYQVDSKNILIDPMFGKVAAPHSLLGGNRFNSTPPISINDLPEIDIVLISHDHYDHLDYETINQLKDKVKHYIVPLGVGVHLEAWGIKPEQISEKDWWENINYDGINFICTPAQHFSGRKLTNGQSTLWCSWVITSSKENIFFSGDSGYANHFKEIGEKYGPFDIALMECGQYNKMWSDIHMMPEESVQASIDIKTTKVMPIHWGGFKLALHSWTDPITRFNKKAEKVNIKSITPKIGEEIKISDSTTVYSKWWINN